MAARKRFSKLLQHVHNKSDTNVHEIEELSVQNTASISMETVKKIAKKSYIVFICGGAICGGAFSGIQKVVEIYNEPSLPDNRRQSVLETGVRGSYHLSRIVLKSSIGAAVGAAAAATAPITMPIYMIYDSSQLETYNEMTAKKVPKLRDKNYPKKNEDKKNENKNNENKKEDKKNKKSDDKHKRRKTKYYMFYRSNI
eukprot:228724_1